jgi:hypothetical protein
MTGRITSTHGLFGRIAAGRCWGLPMNPEHERFPLLIPCFDDTIQVRFQVYHEAHPEVYEYLLQLAQDMQSRGFRHYGMKALFEKVRWHFQVEKGLEDFKLNNNYHSRYARLMMAREPDLEGFFELRELKA